MHNPSLRQTPVYEPADVIPSSQHSSLLEWLESTGRLIARDVQEQVSYPEAEEEISDLIVDESSFDDDDDDSDDDLIED
ncbi:MAG: DUF3134 family protein [Oscillatoriales cyanobacterium RM1_1_9]|nr:DUF3134 family protein [Oscillatoriales cyanobacterium SM2_3_0]NJO45588.1 DUF3134 family protein [Oscillatoriales cyanobacterium RM2_1_1]NJO71091.1 DUF3134 family protein [Oscillatoriales cyanobacterium RM1_1_9]